MKKSLLIACIILPTYSWAQSVLQADNTFYAAKAVNQADGTEVVYNCSFITHTNQVFDWSQRSGARVSHYNITSTAGEWADLQQNGSMVLNLENDSVTGTATITRANGVLSIHLQMWVNGQTDLDYVFSISSVETAQP